GARGGRSVAEPVADQDGGRLFADGEGEGVAGDGLLTDRPHEPGGPRRPLPLLPHAPGPGVRAALAPFVDGTGVGGARVARPGAGGAGMGGARTARAGVAPGLDGGRGDGGGVDGAGAGGA